MFCQYCGQKISEQKKGLSIASFILGLLGLVAWLLPIVGFSVVIVGLVLGIIGQNKGAKRLAVAGIVLCEIALVLTTANSAIGAYKGFHGLLSFQQNDTIALKEKVEQIPSEFSLRDDKGNILMQGGIDSARPVIITDETGMSSYVVEITFTDAAAEAFSKLTEEHIGDCIGIYLNDDMLANPMVRSTATGGICHIDNMPSYQDAADLAEKLNMTKYE